MNARQISLGIVTLASISFASAFGAGGMRPSADYGMAGCGLGTYLFKNNDKSQILAATTNAVSGSQTFGITFGTSNCGRSARIVSADYIAVNEEALRKDAARGSGESLQGLAHIWGCPSDRFGSSLKSRYAEIFSEVFGAPEAEAGAIADRIHRVIVEDSVLAHSCAALT